MYLVVAALLAGWLAPVPGGVTRGFDLGDNPFEGGRHRGADFAAPMGTPVRATCAGRVAVAGRVGTSGGVVTIRCGPWRVTELPLATIAVRRGRSVREGERIGTAASSPGHAGLHLGVRGATARFGYVDPLRFLTSPTTAPPVGPAARPRKRAARPAPAPAARPAPAMGPAPAPAVRPAPAIWPVPAPAARPAPPPGSNPPAPWPVWAGLGLALAGAVGVAARGRPRSRRSPLPHARGEPVR
jgi:murein DD-endopeptidase MepM/ murein hydrolase activator NlpD